MSLQWQLSRTIPEDTAHLGRLLLRETNRYRLIGDHFSDLYPDETAFTPLYETTGRGAISPVLLSAVTVFQRLERVPDRLAAEYVVSRIDWKYALHLPLTYAGFDFSVLCLFRARLIARQQERLVFDQVIDHLKQLGLLASGGKVRTDSTHIIALVERLGCLELVTESIRLALKAATDVVPEWVKANIPTAFSETYRDRQSAYGLSDSAVQTRLITSGGDGLWFLGQWDQAVPVSADQVPEAVTLLRTVLAQQFPNGDAGKPPSKRPRGHDIIDSPHEPEARTATKRDKPWTGYKLQVTESCDDGKPRLINDVDMTNACVPDNLVVSAVQQRLTERGLKPKEHYGDQGYISAENLARSAAVGITLMGRPGQDTCHRPGFQLQDFQIEEGQHQARCPAGQVSRYWHEEAVPGGQQRVKIRFDRRTCRQCPSFGLCTKSTQGRSIELHPFRDILAARRAEALLAEFRRRLHVRAGVERTIADLVLGCGLRYACYRGMAKVRLQGLFTAIGVNLTRVARWWAAGSSRPLAGTAG